ncbi:ATP-binding cassette domain-containing protein [Pelagibius sp. CAU 1746]|uniref:ATP-binding cassette domain-containing protein n=1 Tax=Pelagibius sp. CAU 1746 TaxID=3140370 RepID=UPI00325A4783
MARVAALRTAGDAAAGPQAAAGTRGAATIWPVALHEVCFSAGGKTLIDRLSLQLSPSRRSIVMGPNGAGKSLLLRLTAGLLTPDSGRVTYAGQPLDAGLRRRVAVVFQRPVLLRRSVAANLMHALKTYGVPRGERAQRRDALLALGQLQDIADRPARVLSGGEQQRLSMVRALAAEPDLLLLDEPTASLDPQATAAIEALVDRAAAEGVKIVMVTHDRGQALRLADEVLFLHRGQLIERAPAETFFAQPQSAAAQAYLEGRLLL